MAGIKIIGVLAKWIFEFNRNAIQAPKYKDLRPTKYESPARLLDPNGHYNRHCHPVQHQQKLSRLGIGKGKRHGSDGHRLVITDHAPSSLLKSPCQDRRRSSHHIVRNVLHNQLLYPMKDQLHLAMALLQRSQALRIQASQPDDLDCLVQGGLARSATAIQITQGSSVDDAEEPHQCMPELPNYPRFRGGAGREGSKAAGSIKPFSSHAVDGLATIPKAAIRLAGPEDHDKANQ
mmetsp:Transcript_105658/g.202927  ORF Transcript_105658/g.202927 Transcript_105658/m.202927 type:complete len:234 (+) Transcript_105658:688-1389(+)